MFWDHPLRSLCWCCPAEACTLSAASLHGSRAPGTGAARKEVWRCWGSYRALHVLSGWMCALLAGEGQGSQQSSGTQPSALPFLPCFPYSVSVSCPANCSHTQNNRYGLETSGGTQRRLLAIPTCCECGQLLDVWGKPALSSGAVVRTSLLSNLPLFNCLAASRKAPAENRFLEHASALQSLF